MKKKLIKIIKILIASVIAFIIVSFTCASILMVCGVIEVTFFGFEGPVLVLPGFEIPLY